MIHTSGTSSAPRPVELTYGNLLWSALGSAVALGLDPRERWLCALPVSHVGGLSILVRSAIYATTAVVHERFETDRVLHALREQEVTLVSLVATTLARLLDAGLRAPAGAALRADRRRPGARRARAPRERGAGVPVSLTYGLTETCSQVTTTPAAALARATSAPGRRCSARACAAPPTGRSSSPVRPSPRRSPADGWLHTGDLGAFDERGRLRVTGRKADTIVSGGENVAPSEVEAVLEAHPDVLEAAVVGLARTSSGARPSRRSSSPGRAARPTARRCARTAPRALAPYKVPKRVLLRGEPLPRTRSGKLLRRELR